MKGVGALWVCVEGGGGSEAEGVTLGEEESLGELPEGGRF